MMHVFLANSRFWLRFIPIKLWSEVKVSSSCERNYHYTYASPFSSYYRFDLSNYLTEHNSIRIPEAFVES